MAIDQVLILLVAISGRDENKCWKLLWDAEIRFDFRSEPLFLSRQAESLETSLDVYIMTGTLTTNTLDLSIGTSNKIQ